MEQWSIQAWCIRQARYLAGWISSRRGQQQPTACAPCPAVLRCAHAKYDVAVQRPPGVDRAGLDDRVQHLGQWRAEICGGAKEGGEARCNVVEL